MVDPKKPFLIGVISLLVGVSLTPSTVLAASKKQFFDFGPYYSQHQVLGLSLSSLENLPVPQIPPEIIPPAATGLLPGSFFYPLEKAAENIQLTFTFDPAQKEQLRIGFAAERLSEAKTLLDQGKTEAAFTALDDYSQTVRVVAQNLSGQTLADRVEEKLAQTAVFAQSIILSSPPVQAEQWNAVLDASNQVLDKAAELKGEPAIPEDLSASIQSLKQDGLISEEQSNKLYSFGTRSAVREELDKLVSSGQFPPSELNKLDTAIADKYPKVQEQLLANMQFAEIRSYQSLPQPPKEVMEGLEEWKKDQTQAPPNDIKPYLWYNRAQDLAKEVDLSNFPAENQAEVGKLYPQAVADNPTYTPSPSSSPIPSPTSQPSPNSTQSDQTDQTVSSSPSPAPSSASAVQPYLGATSGALPGDPSYNIKRINEQLSLFFTFDPKNKAQLKMQQSERRLAEASALAADPKKASLFITAIKEYKATLDDASNYLKNAPENRESRELAKKLEAQAARHEVILEKGLVAVSEDSKAVTEAIKATEDAMDKAADAQDKPALPPVLASRLGDLKAQGLILPEEADGLVRSDSRQEVREKIRKLTELGVFPPADAKKLDEAQLNTISSEYNQLVEVRKVEELQVLRSAQADFAQTPSLKTTASTLEQKETALSASIETGLISEGDLKGRDDLVKTYKELASQPRPINGGQFGADVKAGGTSPSPSASPTTPRRSDAVLSVCPQGAVFKQLEGCVWADSGNKLNDYEQYKCDGPRQYYSFAARKCVPYESGEGFREDAQPVCPLGYNWNWQAQSCQTSAGGGIPLPTPKPEEEPKDDKEIEERSKLCPDGASYKAPDGCVWDKDGKKVYDGSQYRCSARNYYSFEAHKCVPAPKEGEEAPKDASPSCKEANSWWSWSEGKCVVTSEVSQELGNVGDLNISRPLITPDSPFYGVKQWGDTLALAVSITPEAKAQTRISQAKERLAESIYVLEKGDEELFGKTLAAYTAKMQELYNGLAKTPMSEAGKKAISERLSTEAAAQNLLLQKAQVLAVAEQENAISAASSAIILGVDKAADLAGGPAIPEDTKAKIEALPQEMISEEDKKTLLETNSRVEARLAIGQLAAKGALTTEDTSFLSEDFDQTDSAAKVKLEELKKLEEISSAKEQKEKIIKKVEENEKIVKSLNEFEKTFEEGKEIPAEIRPYVRLTRIEEVAQTIRPDVVKLEDFQNRKDVVLAVATLQQEFRPTQQAIAQVQDFRRRNPGANLPPELARIEALSYSLGVRNQAAACFLPPPFPANTPCPAPGAALPINSYFGFRPDIAVDEYRPGWSGGTPVTASLDKDGKPLVYGQGPKAENAGVCPSGYHWMYDSGGWCMSNSGSYGSYNTASYSSTGPGSTPYSPYYTAPGVSPATQGYPAPSYYGSAPTYYTTNPPAGTVPGSGPQPTASGQCPSGFHWMPPYGSQAGWCMADSGTYVPAGSNTSYSSGVTTSSTPPPGGYNCGSQAYDPATKKCKDGACPGGFNWDGSKCVAGPTGGGYYSPNLNQSSCGPGYYWDGRGCIATSPSDTASSYQYGCTPGYYWNGSKCAAGSYEGSGWSDTAARSQSWCQPPSGGCGSNSYWDYGSCYCRSSSTYYGGGGPSPSNQCQGLSCGGGAWLDYSTCSCKYSGGSGTSSSGSTITCYPPSAGCPGGWYEYSTCSCKSSSSSGSGSSSGSCPSGSHWMSENGGYCMSDASRSSGGGSTSGGSTSGGTSGGSCPSGYHWMSDNGGWCMSDGGASSGGSTTTSSPAPTTTTETPPASSAPAPTTTEPAPAPTTTESAPAPTTTEPAPAPTTTEPAPAP